jgi:hypothetical protein
VTERAHALTATANRIVLDTIASALDHVAGLERVVNDDPVLVRLAQHAAREDGRLRGDVLTLIASRPRGCLRAYL